MKKNVLLSSLFFAMLFLGGIMTPAMAHGGANHQMPPQNPAQVRMHYPRINHHPQMPPKHNRNHDLHRVRHYYGFSRPYYYSYYDVNYPMGYVVPNVYHPIHHGHFGATFHISL